MGKRLLAQILGEEKGNVLIIVAAALIALLAITAFTVDVGYLYFQKRHLQNAADAAALAGARELIDGSDVNGQVEKYVIAHELDVTEIEAITSTTDRVTVELRGNRDLYFANIIGFSDSDIYAKATAVIGPPEGMKGLIPIGLQNQVYEALAESGESHYIITFENFGQIGPGNWGFVNLTGGPGQQSTKDQIDNIKYGYPDMVYIGTAINYDTGGNLGAPGQLKDYDYRLDEYIDEETILYIPIVEDLPSTGTSQKVKILGFAAIVLQDYEGSAKNYKISAIVKPEDSIFSGGFIKPGEPEYGLYGIALIE